LGFLRQPNLLAGDQSTWKPAQSPGVSEEPEEPGEPGIPTDALPMKSLDRKGRAMPAGMDIVACLKMRVTTEDGRRGRLVDYLQANPDMAHYQGKLFVVEVH